MIYRFKDFSLDTSSLELCRGDDPIALEPQVFSILVHLIENRDRVVGKDELIEAVWGGRAISDGSLNTRINAARRAVGDSGSAQSVIKTFTRRGFRFVADVANDPGNDTDVRVHATGPEKPSIAVLPFVNLSGDQEQEYFADGITEDIIAALSRIRQFFVIARNSTFQYKGSSPDIRQVARDLGVRYVLEGSVRKAGERIRISAQLVDGATGNHLWAERFDRKLDDVFAIQDEITQAIVGHIGPELDRAEYERVKGKAPENLDAWELFHRGMALVVTRSRDDNRRARQLFERSLERDPEFAPAYSGIAWSQTEDLYFGFEKHDTKLVLDHARRAVALDDKNPFSHAVLAQALGFAHQPDLAIDEARQAIRINPSLAMGHGILGRLLNNTGHCQEAIEHAEMAIRLSPSDPHIGQIVNVLAIGNFYMGNYEKAVEHARTVIQRFDTWAPWLIITAALGHLGDRDGAAEAHAEVKRHQPGFSIDQVRNEFVVFHEPYREQLLEGLRKAGVPEK